MKHQIHELFSIPVYQSTIPPIDQSTFDRLISFEWEQASYNIEKPDHKETAERHILDLPEFVNLRRNVQHHIDYFVYEVLGVSHDQQWRITTSWVNKTVEGGSTSAHWHSNSLISGVVYLKTTPGTGAICFHKEKSHKTLWTDTIKIDFEKTTDYNTDAVALMPLSHQILMFPSLLTHSVLEHNDTEDRYSLAFNVFPRGVIGHGGNCEISL